MSESHHKKELKADEIRIPSDSIWARMPLICGIIGLVGLVLAVLVGGSDAESFYASYLVVFMFFLSIGLGGLFFTLVHYAVRAGWSVLVRRLAENAAASLSVLGLLLLPLLLVGVNEIYHWAHFEHAIHAAEQGEGEGDDAEAEEGASGELGSAATSEGEHGEAAPFAGMTADEIRASDPILAGKLAYLNVGAWRTRAVIYVVIWALLGWYFRSRSVLQDRTGDKRITRQLQGLSAPGLILFALTMTFASFDWLMTLDPHWFSTIFGVYYFSSCVIAIYAFLTIISVLLQRSGLLTTAISKEHYHDLGKMLFAFTVFWAYIAFSQYMLIWYANIPEETIWYNHRWVGSWKGVSILIMVGHFVVPFFYLMSRHMKRQKYLLLAGSVWMLLMILVDFYWLVVPVFHESGPAFGVVDLLLLVGVGGLFMAGFTWYLRRDALVPVKDPRLPESMAFENF